MTDLKEGQYRIGDFVFGNGTQCQLSSFEAVGYSVVPGDYSIPQSDELRFRKDYLQPGVINMTVSIMDNYLIDDIILDGPIEDPVLFSSADELLEKFMKEWRSDDIRELWGYVKPLTYCRGGQVRRVYGRPRDIAAPPRRLRSGWYDVTCAFQRADTLSYKEGATGLRDIPVATTVSISREDGAAPTWFEIYLTGPITNPKITLGSQTIELDHSLPAGGVIHISSYPWDRRVVSSAGHNLAAKMVGDSPYLSDLRFPAGATIPVSFTGGGASSDTRLAVLWREAYHSL